MSQPSISFKTIGPVKYPLNYKTAVLNDNPLLYAPLNEAVGATTAINLGSLGGTLSYQGFNIAIAQAPLRQGDSTSKSYYFNSAYLQYPSTTLGNLVDDFTVECWAVISGGGEAMHGLYSNDGTQGNSWLLYKDSNGIESSYNFTNEDNNSAGDTSMNSIFGASASTVVVLLTVYYKLGGPSRFTINGMDVTQTVVYGGGMNGSQLGFTFGYSTHATGYGPTPNDLVGSASDIAIYTGDPGLERAQIKYGIGIGGGDGFSQYYFVTDSTYLTSSQNKIITNNMGNSTQNESYTIATSIRSGSSKQYFEGIYKTKVASPYVNEFAFGFSQCIPAFLGASTTSQNVPLGGSPSNLSQYSYTSDGNIYGNNVLLSSGNPTLNQGDVVGWNIDFVNGFAWVSVNGTQIGVGANPVTGANPNITFTPVLPANGVISTYYPSVSTYTQGTEVQIALISSDYKYAPASGFSAFQTVATA